MMYHRAQRLSCVPNNRHSIIRHHYFSFFSTPTNHSYNLALSFLLTIVNDSTSCINSWPQQISQLEIYIRHVFSINMLFISFLFNVLFNNWLKKNVNHTNHDMHLLYNLYIIYYYSSLHYRGSWHVPILQTA